MTCPHLGFAVIVNNVASEIPDSVQDVEKLSQTLRNLGYTIEVYNDRNMQVTDCVGCVIEFFVHWIELRTIYELNKKSIDLKQI